MLTYKVYVAGRGTCWDPFREAGWAPFPAHVNENYCTNSLLLLVRPNRVVISLRIPKVESVSPEESVACQPSSFRLLSSLELSDANVYAPETRQVAGRAGTASGKRVAPTLFLQNMSTKITTQMLYYY